MEAVLKFYMRKISTWGYVSEPLTPLIHVILNGAQRSEESHTAAVVQDVRFLAALGMT